MNWLISRQHRYEILGLLLGAALIAVALIYGAEYAPRIRAELGVDTCQPLPTTANCAILSTQLSDRLQPFRWLVVSLFFLPAVVGSFVGGPLFARDLERGTHRLVWTQGITRIRWSATKLLTILGVAAIAAAMIAAVGGRASAINGVPTNTFQSISSGGLAIGVPTNSFQNFDFEGPAFVAYVIFAIAIAAFVGTLSRRILVGMFAGLLLFGAARLGVELELRPNYEPPIAVVYSAETPFPQAQVPGGAWVVRVDYVDAEGRVVPQDRVLALNNAFRPQPPRFDMLPYMAEHGAYQRVRFQPVDRYWRFQWTEGLLFLGLTGGLSVMTLTLLKQRDA